MPIDSLYGSELNESITPVEAGVGWAVRNKKADFIGKEVLLKQKKEGTARTIAAFEMEGRAMARHEYSIFSEGKQIGIVTSGGFSPTFKKSLGLALIESGFAQPGTKIELEIRNKKEPAIIVKKPFYQFAGGTNV